MKHLPFYFILFILYSCSKYPNQKLEYENKNPNQVVEIENSKFNNRNIFAAAFSKTLNNNPQLSSLIKEMAMNEFNGSNDVLYWDLMNKTINGKMVNDCIKEDAEDKNLFQKAIENSPLLTIYIPKLPSGWNIKKWDPTSEKTSLVIGKNLADNKRVMNYYDANGNLTKVSDQLIPSEPTLVIKENARVILKPYADLIKRTYDSQSDYPVFYKNINGEEFYILSKRLLEIPKSTSSYNTSTKKIENSLTYNTRFETKSFNPIAVYNPNPFDLDFSEAFYYFGQSWPRDFIYYGLTPTNTTGIYNSQSVENMLYFWFESAAIFPLISTETTDPKIILEKFSNSDPSWTSGSYTITFTILVNAKNGFGPTIKKVIAINPDDVWEVVYTKNGNWYKFKSISSKTAAVPINLDLLDYDLSNYSLGWKISVENTRPTEVQTITNTYVGTFTQNVSYDIGFGEVVKFGLKFGASASQQITQTHTSVTTFGSVQFGDMTIQFQDPILLNGGIFGPFKDYSTGVVGGLIIPQKQY